MHARLLLVPLVVGMLFPSFGLGQSDGKSADKPAETPAPTAGKPAGEKPAADATAAKDDSEFGKLFAQWNDLLKRLEALQVDYKQVKPVERKKIRAEFAKVVKEGAELQPKLIAAASAAYAAAPNKDQNVSDILVSTLRQDARDDDFERLLPIAKLLVEHKYPNPRIYSDGGIAAYELEDYDLAEKWLKQAQTDGVIDSEGHKRLDELADSKTKWAREKETRAKEDHPEKGKELPQVELKTSKGTIVIELFENEAPNAVANFISLVEKGFYNGLTFHRVMQHFMAQGGDPQGSGGGGPGYTIACECDQPNHRDHFRGSLSMAHAGKDTGGSQFFLTFVRTSHLDGKHTVFGRVISGWDVLAQLQRRDPNDPQAPLPDRILSATVVQKRDHKYEPTKMAEK